MNKLLTSIFLAIFLIGIVQASILTDLQSNEALNISINLTENTTEITWLLDTNGLPNDIFEVEYEEIIIEDIYLSELLKGIDFNVAAKDGEKYPVINSINISGAYTKTILNNLLNVLNYSFDSDDINDNPSLLIDLLKAKYSNQVKMIGNAELIKTGTNYKITYDKGAEYLNDYKLDNYNFTYSLLSNNLSFKLDLTNIQLVNGVYEIQAEIGLNGEKITKTAQLVISGLTTQTYTPLENLSISKIEGLAFGTNIIYSEESVSSYTAPNQVTGLQVMNISASVNTSGEIYFKINKSQVSNKDKISLYVLEGTWTKLVTTYLVDNGLEYEFKATTPHFSIFMIGEEVTSSSSSGGSSHHSHSSSRTLNDGLVSYYDTSNNGGYVEDKVGVVEGTDLISNKPKEPVDWLRFILFFFIGCILSGISVVIIKKVFNKSKEESK